jgi:hypothetical protein
MWRVPGWFVTGEMQELAIQKWSDMRRVSCLHFIMAGPSVIHSPSLLPRLIVRSTTPSPTAPHPLFPHPICGASCGQLQVPPAGDRSFGGSESPVSVPHMCAGRESAVGLHGTHPGVALAVGNTTLWGSREGESGPRTPRKNPVPGVLPCNLAGGHNTSVSDPQNMFGCKEQSGVNSRDNSVSQVCRCILTRKS